MKAEDQNISTKNQNELDKRLEHYHDNPDDLLDWEDIENKW
jgi:hypothetical protein